MANLTVAERTAVFAGQMALMAEYSEAVWRAGWDRVIERDLWNGHAAKDETARHLRQLARLSGAWLAWQGTGPEAGPRPVPLADWVAANGPAPEERRRHERQN